jgi:hypothetical protein
VSPVKALPEPGDVKHTVTVYDPEDGVLAAQMLSTMLPEMGIDAGSNAGAAVSWAYEVTVGIDKTATMITNRILNNRLIPIFPPLALEEDSLCTQAILLIGRECIYRNVDANLATQHVRFNPRVFDASIRAVKSWLHIKKVQIIVAPEIS